MKRANSTVFGDPLDPKSQMGPIANKREYDNVLRYMDIFTTDMKKAIRTSEELQAGVVWVNTWSEFDVSAAFGGYKMSGYVRERGLEAFDNYLQIKTVWLNHK